MKKLTLLLAVLAIAVPALAATLTSADPAPLFAGEQPGGTPRGTVVYSDTTTITAAYAAPAPNETGDELDLNTSLYPNPTGTNYIDSVKWSTYNKSGNAALATVGMLIKFYDVTNYLNPILLGGLNFGTYTFSPAMPGGYYTTFSATGLAPNLIPVPANGFLLASLTLSAPSNGQQVGQVLANPPTIGSSTNDFWVGPPPGSWYWFGSTGPIANFYWEIDVTPEPAAFLMLAGALLFVRRR